jgi:hypothetical protein
MQTLMQAGGHVAYAPLPTLQTIGGVFIDDDFRDAAEEGGV